MSTFTQRGSLFFVTKPEDGTSHMDLPVATYTVAYNEQTGEFYLKLVDDFTLPSKIYGSSHQQADRILNTFWRRDGSTGVHLDGVKGSGKTLLVKNISVRGRAENLPTIVVNQPFCGDGFNAFIQSIDTPAIIVFDEFEKIYDYDTQNKILTLFDGVYSTKKLFVLTTNDSYRVSGFLKNRPGRMYYNIEYDVMEPGMIEEYLDDCLEDQSRRASIIKYSQVFTFLNFDMLVAIVEEMNRYGESLGEVLKLLNVKPEMKSDETYTIELQAGEREAIEVDTTHDYDPNIWSYWVNASDVALALGVALDDDDDDRPREVAAAVGNRPTLREIENGARKLLSQSDDDYEFTLEIEPAMLTGFDGAKSKFTYEIKAHGTKFKLFVTRDPIQVGRTVFNTDAF